MSSKKIILILPFVVICFIALSSFAHASTNSPQFSYSFDSDFTDSTNHNNLVRDSGGGGTDASISGAIFRLGNGSARFFGGTANQHGLKSLVNFSIPTTMSVNAWINLTKVNSEPNYPIFNYQSISFGSARWDFYVLFNGSLVLDIRNTTGNNFREWISPSLIANNTWAQIGIVQSGISDPTFYVNGTAYVGQRANFGSTNLTASPVGIAARTFVGENSNLDTLRGHIDELSIWNKALTTADMVGLYNNGAGATYPYSTTSDINFSVVYNSTQEMVVAAKVTTRENSTGLVYKYALECDLSTSTLWNEQFNTFYNFTTENVTTSFANPQSFLTFDGLQWTSVVSAVPSFDIIKNSNLAYRDYLRAVLSYQTNNDNIGNLVYYDDGHNAVLYLILNKTGSNLIVTQQDIPTGVRTNIVNFTLSGGLVNLALQFTPHTRTDSTLDFLYTIQNSNSTGIQPNSPYETTPSFSTIKNVEVFSSNLFNGTTLYKQLGLYRTNNPNPAFTTFQNGLSQVQTTGPTAPEQGICIASCVATCGIINDVTFGLIGQCGGTSTGENEAYCAAGCVNGTSFVVKAPSATPSIAGDGYTVVPDYNNVFYGLCEYSKPGSYTQRHFMADIGGVDNWNDYVDLTITSAQVSSNTSTTNEGGNAGAGTGDIGTDLLPSFLRSLGFKSTASLLLAWTLIVLFLTLIVAALSRNALISILVFVIGMIIGVPLGLVPLWVLIIFVIIAAGLFALGLKYVFAG